MYMQIVPLQDRVVLKKMEAKKETASGIVLPKEHNDSPNLFTVVSVGPLAKDKLGYELSAGDKVLKGQYSGDDIKVDSQDDIVIVAAEYILAKLDV